MATFHCTVVTPERVVLDCQARAAVIPAHDGEMGILPHRAPFLVRLGIGRLRVTAEGGEQIFMVAGGFAQMVGDKLTLLTEQASRPEELDRAQSERALAAARLLPIGDDASFETRQRALQKARAELQIGL